ncbi:MAG: ACP S-malonyltransferase [Elusimicrobia bacterium]|nr:ACP S-malonyltransferase [Elusimicrobiota bacterium]
MPEKYCVMFAGQSVQESGMGKSLLKLPAARDIVGRLKPSLGDDLEFLLTQMPEAELALTFNAQRAIHAHHLANFFAYQASHPGLELDGAIGHSMGVVAALVAAGALSVEDSGKFIRARAESFSRACRSFQAPMGLAAVSTENFQDVADELATFPGVKVALHNTVGRGVLGGAMADLEAFKQKARNEDWPVKISLLKVEGPYHTPAFSSCRAELERALASLEIKAPRVPVFMGTSGRMETDPVIIKRLLAEQTDSPERHLEAVRAAYAAGCRNFLEVAHKPQPVTWLADQLKGDDGAAWPGVSALAVKTEDIEG